MMPLEEVVRLIDPALAVKRRLEPSALVVYEVEKERNRYILKISSPNHGFSEISEWRKEHIYREKDILRIANDVPGITHLVHDYGDIEGCHAILKEYFEGKNLIELSRAREPFMQSAGNRLKETLERLHSLGFAELDVKPYNVIISPDGRDARIIDLGMYITASEVGQEKFEHKVITDNIHLQEILSYVNGE